MTFWTVKLCRGSAQGESKRGLLGEGEMRWVIDTTRFLTARSNRLLGTRFFAFLLLACVVLELGSLVVYLVGWFSLCHMGGSLLLFFLHPESVGRCGPLWMEFNPRFVASMSDGWNRFNFPSECSVLVRMPHLAGYIAVICFCGRFLICC